MHKVFFLLFVSFCFVGQGYGQTTKYFPDYSKDISGLDLSDVSWNSEVLSVMKEPVIFRNETKTEAFRFIWLRTFDHPIVIRIEKHEDAYFIYWKMCSGAGGYELGKLIVDKQKSISKMEWIEFIDRLNQADFWKMETRKRYIGLDGATWLLEGKFGNHYHVVDRWSPGASSDFYKCCDYLIGLTDLKIKPDRKY